MQVAPVIHTNLDLRKVALRPFDGTAVEPLQPKSTPAVGPIYTKEGQIRRDPERPVGYKPIYAIA